MKNAERGRWEEIGMFVYSVRASTLKFFAFILVTVALLVGIVVWGGADSVFAMSDATEINYSGIKTNEDRLAFIKGFGIEVNETPTEEKSFSMPDSFDRVIAGYNEVQKSQGLDLSKYANKKVTRYTYEVTNFADAERTVYANIFVYRNRIIACDVSSAEPDGFVYALTRVDSAMFRKK